MLQEQRLLEEQPHREQPYRILAVWVLEGTLEERHRERKKNRVEEKEAASPY